MTYHKILYGYHIDSDIDLPYLLDYKGQEAKGPIVIRSGFVPETIANIIYQKKTISLSPNEVRVDIGDVASFHVLNDHNKTSIIYQPKLTVPTRELIGFLCGSVLLNAIHFFKELHLHAGSINITSNTVLIAGQSGAGKSSLLAEFVQSGKKLITDDISIIRKSNSNFIVAPGHPNLRLFKDTAERFGFSLQEKHKIRIEYDKYWVPLTSEFENESHPVTYFFLLKKRPSERVTFSEVTGIRKIRSINSMIAQKPLVKAHNWHPDLFEKSADFANDIHIFEVSRPVGFHTKTIADKIEEIVENHDKQ